MKYVKVIKILLQHIEKAELNVWVAFLEVLKRCI